jgi:hypothetical protein
VIDALREARVLSPLIAEAGDYGLNDQGLMVEKTQELSVVHLEGPDGRAVAPVFLDVASMVAWRSDARPIPVEASKAALAAASDGLGLIVLNPGSEHSVILRRGALEALAAHTPYTPPWVDREVIEAIEAGLMGAGVDIPVHKILPGDRAQVLAGPEIVVAVGLSPGLSAAQVQDVVARISAVWSANDLLTRRVDGLGVKVLPL